MNRNLTTMLMLLAGIATYAQDYTINYGYDTAGNRISKVPNPSSSNASNGITSPQDLLAEVNALINQETVDEDATNNEKSSLQLEVFPNPATDKITITKSSKNATKTNQKATTLLLDSQGNIVDQIASSDVIINFNIQSLAQGVYYVYYVGNKDKMAWRVVKK